MSVLWLLRVHTVVITRGWLNCIVLWCHRYCIKDNLDATQRMVLHKFSTVGIATRKYVISRGFASWYRCAAFLRRRIDVVPGLASQSFSKWVSTGQICCLDTRWRLGRSPSAHRSAPKLQFTPCKQPHRLRLMSHLMQRRRRRRQHPKEPNSALSGLEMSSFRQGYSCLWKPTLSSRYNFALAPPFVISRPILDRRSALCCCCRPLSVTTRRLRRLRRCANCERYHTAIRAAILNFCFLLQRIFCDSSW